MSIRAGYIGLGDIGKPMAERIVRGGLDTTVFDVREEPCRDLAALGAHVAGSCRELAERCDIIGVCVRDDDEVKQVALGSEGIMATAQPESIVALHSTILPRTIEEVARAGASRHIGVIDAPMTGGAAGAENGTLTYMVGGDALLLSRCRPVLETSAARIVHTGALGSGAATKLCNNLIGYLEFLAVFEASLLATHAGLSKDVLLEVTRSSGHMTNTMATFLSFRQTMDERPDDSALQAVARHFTAIGEKDLAVTLAFARQLGITLPGSALCQQVLARVYGLQDAGRR